jgi:K+-sensing histidine kinase KdpD
MDRWERTQIWAPLAALGAMAIGVALIPLREATSASNLAFVFLAFTIVMAELGGALPALVAALVSAMSLNFFLTEPYLTLAISKTDDLIAFVALAACGLIAAAFGSRRARWSGAAGRAHEEITLLRRLVDQVRGRAALDRVLGDLARVFGLGAMVLRDVNGRVVAVTPPEAGTSSRPEAEITLESPLPAAATVHRFGSRGLRLPEGGGRLRLETNRGPMELDLWEGDSRGLDIDQWRTLQIAVAILELRLPRAPG